MVRRSAYGRTSHRYRRQGYLSWTPGEAAPCQYQGCRKTCLHQVEIMHHGDHGPPLPMPSRHLIEQHRDGLRIAANGSSSRMTAASCSTSRANRAR